MKIQRKPLVGISLSFATGCLFAIVFETPQETAVATALVFFILSLLSLGSFHKQTSRRWLFQVPILATCFLCGLGWSSIKESRLQRQLDCMAGKTSPYEIIVTEEPEIRVDNSRKRCRFEGEIDCEECPFKVTVILSGHIYKYPQYGEKWSINGDLVRWKTRNFLRANMHGSEKLSAGHGLRFKNTLIDFRREAARLLSLGIEEYLMDTALLRALVLGYKGEMPTGLRDLFAATGTLHMFAISGLHVVVIAGFVAFVLSLFSVSRERWGFYMIPLLICYVIITGAGVSQLRALLVSSIVIVAPLLKRRSDFSSAMGLAVLILLVRDPRWVIDAGFLLSFLVTAGLVFLFPLLNARCAEMWAPDELVIGDEPLFVRCRKGLLRFVVTTWNVALVAWLVSMPLMLFFFQRITPVSLLSNLIIAPFGTLLLFACCTSLVAGSCIESVGIIINNASLAISVLLRKSMSLLLLIPFSDLQNVNPPSWFYAVYEGLFLLLCLEVLGQSPSKDKKT